MASFARSTRSDSRSQSARISTPSILASLRVVPVPRLPRPITATPTVSSAGAAYPCILKLLRLLRITTYSSGLFDPERPAPIKARVASRSEEHTSELQSRGHLVCLLLLQEKNNNLLYKHDEGC